MKEFLKQKLINIGLILYKGSEYKTIDNAKYLLLNTGRHSWDDTGFYTNKGVYRGHLFKTKAELKEFLTNEVAKNDRYKYLVFSLVL